MRYPGSLTPGLNADAEDVDATPTDFIWLGKPDSSALASFIMNYPQTTVGVDNWCGFFFTLLVYSCICRWWSWTVITLCFKSRLLYSVELMWQWQYFSFLLLFHFFVKAKEYMVIYIFFFNSVWFVCRDHSFSPKILISETSSYLFGPIFVTFQALMRRYYLVQRAQDANLIGILVGTTAHCMWGSRACFPAGLKKRVKMSIFITWDFISIIFSILSPT